MILACVEGLAYHKSTVCKLGSNSNIARGNSIISQTGLPCKCNIVSLCKLCNGFNSSSVDMRLYLILRVDKSLRFCRGFKLDL